MRRHGCAPAHVVVGGGWCIAAHTVCSGLVCGGMVGRVWSMFGCARCDANLRIARAMSLFWDGNPLHPDLPF